MRSFVIAAAILCFSVNASAAPSAPKPNYTVELVNLPEGLNCLPETGADSPHGSICAWRLNSNFEAILSHTLDQHLPAGGQYHARFELRNAELVDSPKAPTQILTRQAAYRFTLTDAKGKRIVDRLTSVTDPVYKDNRVLPEQYMDAMELYQPYVVYELFFDIADQIGTSIDTGFKAPVAQK